MFEILPDAGKDRLCCTIYSERLIWTQQAKADLAGSWRIIINYRRVRNHVPVFFQLLVFSVLSFIQNHSYLLPLLTKHLKSSQFNFTNVFNDFCAVQNKTWKTNK